MKRARHIGLGLLIAAAVLLTIFLAGRYGWKLRGFAACQQAGIESVEVQRHAVRIRGFYPGSFPEGFCGCYARQEDGRLAVGFRFSAVFGAFASGDFDVTIPVQGQIREVVVKTRQREDAVWTQGEGFLPQSERYGVYVKLEAPQANSVSMTYPGCSGGMIDGAGRALERGAYYFLDNDIMLAAKEADEPVPFTLTVRRADGTLLASGAFRFAAEQEKMYLTVTADGRIVEDGGEA